MMVTVLVLSICAGVALFQVLYTRSTRRNYARHDQEMRRIYAEHDERMAEMYDRHGR